MKTILVLTMLFIISTLNAQYSNYYTVNENVKVNGNINVNENVKVSGTVNQNIRTIDYGKLALANAENEKTRLQGLIYEDQKAKAISLEIASDPLKAYDYGYNNSFILTKEQAKKSGFIKCSVHSKSPATALFDNAGAGRFQNVSTDGVTTEFTMYLPYFGLDSMGNIYKPSDVEKGLEKTKIGAGTKSDGDSVYFYKVELNRATVYGIKGYSLNLAWEDKYKFGITDNYNLIDDNGIYYVVKARYYGDKDEVTFEQLEGRRYYLKPLIEKIVSTAYISDFKVKK